jgi:hypothetical protein
MPSATTTAIAATTAIATSKPRRGDRHYGDRDPDREDGSKCGNVSSSQDSLHSHGFGSPTFRISIRSACFGKFARKWLAGILLGNFQFDFAHRDRRSFKP